MGFLAAEFAASVTGLSYAAVLPVAAAELDGLPLYGLAVTATAVVSIAFVPFGSFLYGRIGPQAQLSISTAVLVVGVALSVTAPNMEVLVGGLALRGVAAGLMGGLGLGILSGLYPDAKERERAFGLYALMWVAPSVLGPAVNGVLLLALGWRASMAWPILLMLTARALISHYLRQVEWERPSAPAKVRAAGAFLAVAAGLALAQTSIATARLGWAAAALILLVVVLVLPFRHALRRTVPGERRAQAGGWALALVCGSYFGINAFIPLLSATHVDATGVLGAFLVALGPITWALMSAGGAGARLGPRTSYLIAAIGFPAAASGVALWALALPAAAVTGAIGLGVLALLIGAAMGAVYPKVMTLAFEGFRGEGGTHRAHAGVVLGVGEDVGTTVGVVVLAGIGGVVIAADPMWTAVLVGIVSAVLIMVWAAAGRSELWRN